MSTIHNNGTSTTVLRTTRRTGNTEGGVYDEYCCALIENKGCDVGVAWCNLNTLQFQLTQVSDAQTFTKTMAHLAAFQPTEICLPNTSINSALSQAVHSTFGASSNIVSVRRNLFSDVAGRKLIEDLAMCTQGGGDGNMLDLLQANHYLAIAAFSALVQFVQFSQRHGFANHSLKITYRRLAHYVELDSKSILVLNLLRPRNSGFGAGKGSAKPTSLLDAIDKTMTPMGGRLLSSTLLQPLRDKETIERRLDSVEFLVNRPECLSQVSSFLRTLRGVDAERTAAFYCRDLTQQKTSQASQQISRTVLVTLQFLEQLITGAPGLKKCLEDAGNSVPIPTLLSNVVEQLNTPDYASLRDQFATVIDTEVLSSVTGGGAGSANGGNGSSSTKACTFIVRKGINCLLDVARDRLSQTLESMIELTDTLRQESGISSLKLHAPPGQQAKFQLATSQAHLLTQSPQFVDRYKSGNQTHVTTTALQNLASMYLDSTNEVLQCEGAVLLQLVEYVRKHLTRLHLACETVGLLDMVCSSATVAASHPNMCRPTFTEDVALEIVAGILPSTLAHPGAQYEPNDLGMSLNTFTVLLTGPNASGKTTFLRQTAQLVVLAQIGSFLPAQSAKLRVVDRVMARLTSEDEPDIGASSFAKEVQELARIMQSATSRSLILMDEVGRGTSHLEGTCICWAMIEWFTDMRCTTLLATHLHQLTTVPCLLTNGKNYHCKVAVENLPALHQGGVGVPPPRAAGGGGMRQGQVGLHYLHKVLPGSCRELFYGLRLASRLGFSPQIIHTAKKKLSRRKKDSSIKTVLQLWYRLQTLQTTSAKQAVKMLVLSQA